MLLLLKILVQVILQDDYPITSSFRRWYCLGYGLSSRKQNAKTSISKELGDVTKEDNIRTKRISREINKCFPPPFLDSIIRKQNSCFQSSLVKKYKVLIKKTISGLKKSVNFASLIFFGTRIK